MPAPSLPRYPTGEREPRLDGKGGATFFSTTPTLGNPIGSPNIEIRARAGERRVCNLRLRRIGLLPETYEQSPSDTGLGCSSPHTASEVLPIR
jgi:hypothetical protein